MDAKAKLLLIDDDATLTKALRMYISRAGYEIHSAGNGLEGVRKLFEWETCRRIREMSTVPIIMLTARGQEADRVKGLELGADDYVAKPFSLKELEARVRAVLRRANGNAASKPKILYVTEHLTIDSELWEVRRDGKRLELTSTEARLLFYLVENAGRVLSHRQILENVWGPEYINNSEYTKLFVWRLRQKIEPDPSNPQYILTERGIGYRMAPA